MNLTGCLMVLCGKRQQAGWYKGIKMEAKRILLPRTMNNYDKYLSDGEGKMLCNYEQQMRGRLNIRDISASFDATLTLVIDAYFSTVSKIVAVYYSAYFPTDAGSDYFLLIYGIKSDGTKKLRLLYQTTSGLWKWGDELLTNGEFGGTSGWTESNATLSVSAGIGRVTATSAYGGIYQEVDVEEGKTYELLFRHKSDSLLAVTCCYKVEQFKDPNWSDYIALTEPATESNFGDFVREELTANTGVSKFRIWLMIKSPGDDGNFQQVMFIRDWLADLDLITEFTNESDLRSVIDGNKIYLTDNVNYPFYISFTRDKTCVFGRLGYPSPYSKPVIDSSGYDEDDYDDQQEDEFMGEPGLVHCTYCYVDEIGQKSNPSPVSLAGDMQFFKLWTDEDNTQINRIRQIRVTGLALPGSLSETDKERIKYFEIYLRITLYSEGQEEKVLGLTRVYEIADKDGKNQYTITLPPDYGSYVDYTNNMGPVSSDIAAHDGIIGLVTGEQEISFAGFEYDHYKPISLNNENARTYIDGVIRMRLDGDELGIYWFYLLANLHKVRIFDMDMITGIPVVYDAVTGGVTMTDIIAAENGDFDDTTAGDNWTGWGDPVVLPPFWAGLNTGWRLTGGYYAWCDLVAGSYKDLEHDHVYTLGTTYTVRFYVFFVGAGVMRIYIGTNYAEVTTNGMQEVTVEAAGTTPKLKFRTYSQVKILDTVEVFENSWNTIDVWMRVPMMEQGNVHTVYLVWADQRAGYLGTDSFEVGKFFDVDNDTWSNQKVFENDKIKNTGELFHFDLDNTLYNRCDTSSAASINSMTWNASPIAKIVEFGTDKTIGTNSLNRNSGSSILNYIFYSTIHAPEEEDITRGLIHVRIQYHGTDLHLGGGPSYVGENWVIGFERTGASSGYNFLKLLIYTSGDAGGITDAVWKVVSDISVNAAVGTPGWGDNDYFYDILISWDANEEKVSLFIYDEYEETYYTQEISGEFTLSPAFNMFIAIPGDSESYFPTPCENTIIDQYRYYKNIYLDASQELHKNIAWNLFNFMPYYPSTIIGYEKNPGSTEAHNNNITFGETRDRYDLELRHFNMRLSKRGGMAYPLLWRKECAEVIERIIYSRTVLPLQSQNGFAILMRNGLSRLILDGDQESWGLTNNLIYEQRRYGILAIDSLANTPRGLIYMSESGLILWNTNGIELLSNQPGMIHIPLRDDYVGLYVALKNSYYLNLECAEETVTDTLGGGNVTFSGSKISGHDFESDGFESGMILVITGTKQNNGSYIIESVDSTEIWVYGEFESEVIAGTGVGLTGYGHIAYVYDLQNNALSVFEGMIIENGVELHGGNRVENSNLILDNDVIKIYPSRSAITFSKLTRIRTGRIALGGERRNAVIRSIRIKSSGSVSGTLWCYSENYADEVSGEAFTLSDERWFTLGKGVIAESIEIEITGGNDIEWIELSLKDF